MAKWDLIIVGLSTIELHIYLFKNHNKLITIIHHKRLGSIIVCKSQYDTFNKKKNRSPWEGFYYEMEKEKEKENVECGFEEEPKEEDNMSLKTVASHNAMSV